MSQITTRISASSIDVRALGDPLEPSKTQKLTHMFILKIDGSKVLESAKVPRESLEWAESKEFHFTPSSNIEIAIYRRSRVFRWRKPVLAGEYSGRGMYFLDTSAAQELVDKSRGSRLAIKFHLVAESHAGLMQAADQGICQLVEFEGTDAPQAVAASTNDLVLPASEQSQRIQSLDGVLQLAEVEGTDSPQAVADTAPSTELPTSEQSCSRQSLDDVVIQGKIVKLESSDGRRNEVSFITTSNSGTVQNAAGNIFNGVVHQHASTDELDRRIAVDTNTRMKQTQHGIDKREVQKWIFLADSDTSSNHNAARKVHLAGTGSWFLEGSQFTQWKENSGSVLWLEGGPGSGKTVLFSSAVENIIEFCTLKPVVRGYAYFYFDARSERLQHLAHEKFIRSLISQLSHRCGEEIPTALVSLYNTCDNGQTQPGLTSLEDTLLRVLQCFEDTYIVIDSLDECPAKKEVLEWMHSVTSKSSRKPHLLVTSRTEWEIEKGLARLSSLRHVEIAGWSSESDIKAYIAVALTKADKWKTPGDREMVEDALSRHSKTFRFVALQLHDIMKCQNRAQLKKQLTSLPKDLNEIYQRIFEQSGDAEELQKFLVWLAFSKRDMTRAEIDEVGTVNLGAADGPLYDLDRRPEEPGAILTAGSGLVTTEIDGTVKLAHFSVKEYLIQRLKSMAEKQCCTGEQLSHSVIAHTCLAHLLHFNRESILDKGPPGFISKDHLSFFPLAEYAAEHWVYHFHAAHRDDLHLLKLLLKLFALPRSRAMINWIRLHDPDSADSYNYQWKSLNNIASPLYYASLSGLTQVVQHLISNGADINAVCRDESTFGTPLRTPLIAASVNGHGKLAKLLLDAGADANFVGGDHDTALIIASRDGYFELAKLLLDAGADVNIVAGQYGTALAAASYGGHCELAKLLVDAGADVDTVHRYHGTALVIASETGQVELSQLLLDAGADVNIVGGKEGTALMAACRGGHFELAKLLLGAGADVDVRGRHSTALIAACLGGQFELAKLLGAAEGMNVVRGKHGTALMAACRGRHFELAKLLLGAGADVNVVGEREGTALTAASGGGHFDLVKLLLDAGADVNVMGGEYGTALMAASGGGHFELAKLLLDASADVNFSSTEYGTALKAASRNGRVELVMLLLDAGADVNVMGGIYGAPLQLASDNGNVEITRLLLAAGADVNAAGGEDDSDTALQACSWEGHVEVAKLLLANGADVNAVAEGDYTALHRASQGNHRDVAKLLLDNGADVNAATTGGNFTALHIASRRGHQDVAELLLDNGANVNAVMTESAETALLLASREGHQDIDKLLLDNGAAVNAVLTESGKTALQIASGKGHEKIAELLRERGAVKP